MDNILLDFMMYTEFGITGYESLPGPFFPAITKAYKDATNQGAFNTSLKDDAMKQKAKELNNDAYNFIEDSIDELLEKNLDFNEWHKNTCIELVKLYEENGINFFTIGNSQKWLNMTLKYLYMLDNEFLGKYVEELHVPIDSYILEGLWYLCDNAKEREEFFGELALSTSGEAFNSKIKPWSSWDDYDQYKTIQDKIKKLYGDLRPLSWENKLWRIVAETRRWSPGYKPRREFIRKMMG